MDFDKYAKAAEALDVDEAVFTDYERAKPLLCVEILGTEKNAELLGDMPHKNVEDISMVYRLQLKNDGNKIASMYVNNEMMERYGVSAEQLHADAMESSQMNRPAKIMSMRSVLAGFSELSEDEVMPSGIPEIYVVTGGSGVRGAAAVFYPDMMDEIAGKLDGGYFVLPSSVHEVLVVPDNSSWRVSELTGIVGSVNKSVVEDKDLLSGTVYHYDAEARIFERGESFEARREAKLCGRDVRPSVLKDLQEKKADIGTKTATHETRTKSEQVL